MTFEQKYTTVAFIYISIKYLLTGLVFNVPISREKAWPFTVKFQRNKSTFWCYKYKVTAKIIMWYSVCHKDSTPPCSKAASSNLCIYVKSTSKHVLLIVVTKSLTLSFISAHYNLNGKAYHVKGIGWKIFTPYGQRTLPSNNGKHSVFYIWFSFCIFVKRKVTNMQRKILNAKYLGS